MKILLDHCVPKRFGRDLTGCEVKTAFQMGWSDLDNGSLLAAAADGQFDAFVTVDQNIQYQRNLVALPLPVLLLAAPNNKLATLRPYAPHVLAAVSGLTEKLLLRIHGNGRIEKVASPA